MDEPELDGPHEPGTGPPADPDPAGAAVPPPVPSTHPAPPIQAHRVRAALASRAAGWVVAVALAGAVVALSVVLATAPRGLQVQDVAGPGRIVAIPGPAVRVPAVQVPAGVTGPGQIGIHVVLPGPGLRALCAIGPAARSFQVLPARPGARQPFVLRPGGTGLLPVIVCPGGKP
jgi:hypothetical protein